MSTHRKGKTFWRHRQDGRGKGIDMQGDEMGSKRDMDAQREQSQSDPL